MDYVELFNSDTIFDRMVGELGERKEVAYVTALELIKKKIKENKEFLSKINEIENQSGEGRNSSNTFRMMTAAYIEEVKSVILNEKIKVYGVTSYESLAQDLVADICGYGPLRRAFEDNSISDIYVNRYDDIFVEKNGSNQRYPYVFRDEKHWVETLKRLLQVDSKTLDQGANKVVNFEVYGNRGAAVSPVISAKGTCCSFRKHGQVLVDANKLLRQQILDEEVLEFLGLTIKGGMNTICAGTTGSGKTTTLQALFNHLLDDERLLVVEDTRELQIDAENVVYLVCPDSTTGADAKSSDTKTYTMQDLIYLALRKKPRRIITGEIRGSESKAYLDAAATGHASYATTHAGTPMDAINRIVERFAEAGTELSSEMIERKICDAVDCVFIQANIRNIGRKIVSISEISYNYDSAKPIINPIFEYDVKKNEFIRVGKITEKLERKLLINGVSIKEVEKWTILEETILADGGDNDD